VSADVVVEVHRENVDVPRAKKRTPQRIEWNLVTFLRTIASRSDGRSLIMQVGGDGDSWFAIGVEVPRASNALEVLDDHAHRLVGEFANPKAAQRAAETFTRRWLRGTKIDACGCKRIGTA
jgi:hypothetical protein